MHSVALSFISHPRSTIKDKGSQKRMKTQNLAIFHGF